jgi:hypothetical protein
MSDSGAFWDSEKCTTERGRANDLAYPSMHACRQAHPGAWWDGQACSLERPAAREGVAYATPEDCAAQHSWGLAEDGACVPAVSADVLPDGTQLPGSVQLPPGTAAYHALAECEAAAAEVQPRWGCVSGACALLRDGTGVWDSEAECARMCAMLSSVPAPEAQQRLRGETPRTCASVADCRPKEKCVLTAEVEDTSGRTCATDSDCPGANPKCTAERTCVQRVGVCEAPFAPTEKNCPAVQTASGDTFNICGGLGNAFFMPGANPVTNVGAAVSLSSGFEVLKKSARDMKACVLSTADSKFMMSNVTAKGNREIESAMGITFSANGGFDNKSFKLKGSAEASTSITHFSSTQMALGRTTILNKAGSLGLKSDCITRDSFTPEFIAAFLALPATPITWESSRNMLEDPTLAAYRSFLSVVGTHVVVSQDVGAYVSLQHTATADQDTDALDLTAKACLEASYLGFSSSACVSAVAKKSSKFMEQTSTQQNVAVGGTKDTRVKMASSPSPLDARDFMQSGRDSDSFFNVGSVEIWAFLAAYLRPQDLNITRVEFFNRLLNMQLVYSNMAAVAGICGPECQSRWDINGMLYAGCVTMGTTSEGLPKVQCLQTGDNCNALLCSKPGDASTCKGEKGKTYISEKTKMAVPRKLCSQLAYDINASDEEWEQCIGCKSIEMCVQGQCLPQAPYYDQEKMAQCYKDASPAKEALLGRYDNSFYSNCQNCPPKVDIPDDPYAGVYTLVNGAPRTWTYDDNERMCLPMLTPDEVLERRQAEGKTDKPFEPPGAKNKDGAKVFQSWGECMCVSVNLMGAGENGVIKEGTVFDPYDEDAVKAVAGRCDLATTPYKYDSANKRCMPDMSARTVTDEITLPVYRQGAVCASDSECPALHKCAVYTTEEGDKPYGDNKLCYPRKVKTQNFYDCACEHMGWKDKNDTTKSVCTQPVGPKLDQPTVVNKCEPTRTFYTWKPNDKYGGKGGQCVPDNVKGEYYTLESCACANNVAPQTVKQQKSCTMVPPIKPKQSWQYYPHDHTCRFIASGEWYKRGVGQFSSPEECLKKHKRPRCWVDTTGNNSAWFGSEFGNSAQFSAYCASDEAGTDTVAGWECYVNTSKNSIAPLSKGGSIDASDPDWKELSTDLDRDQYYKCALVGVETNSDGKAYQKGLVAADDDIVKTMWGHKGQFMGWCDSDQDCGRGSWCCRDETNKAKKDKSGRCSLCHDFSSAATIAATAVAGSVSAGLLAYPADILSTMCWETAASVCKNYNKDGRKMVKWG